MSRQRKSLFSLLISLMIFFNMSLVNAQDNNYTFNVDGTKGLLTVAHNINTQNRLKLLVTKDDKQYSYNLNTQNGTEDFPLQMGQGIYKVSILERVEGTTYRKLFSEEIYADIQDENNVFLNSIQEIKWDKNLNAVKKAVEINSGTKTEYEKVKGVYNFIVHNFQYDHEKLKNVNTGYLPQIDEVFEDRGGICYDFASLFAAMLRSQGIPAKMIKGYAKGINGYHAWNEVYIRDENRWITIDTSTDSQMIAAKGKVQMEKDMKAYQKVNEY